MGKYIFFASVLLALMASHLTGGVVIKVVSLYGKNTEKDDLYKQILADAETYINDNRAIQPIIRAGDQVGVIHQRLLEDREFEEQTLSKVVYQVCNNIRSTEAAAVILPNDFCDNCADAGAVLGEAYSPVIALDHADGSGAFKMRPNLDDLEEMITDVISNFKWSTFILIYEGDIGFAMLESLSAKAVTKGWTIQGLEFDEEEFEEQAEMLKKRSIKNILVFFTNEEQLAGLVNTAFDLKVLSNGWHWMFGNLNPPISKSFLEQKYRHNMAFLTRFKIVANDLQYYTSISTPIKSWRFRQRAAYDALVAVAMAMNLHVQREGRYPTSVPVCGEGQKSTLEPYLKQISFRGASGDVSFNDAGDRTNYTINIYSGKDKFAQNLAGFFTQDIKSWQEANGETWPGKPGKRTYIKPFRQSDARVIKVLAVPEPPFFMQKGWEQVRYRKENIKYDNADRNDEPYEGYAWELIKDVKKVFEEEMGIDFNFEITLMSRGQYGSLDLSTGEWDGMIRELIDGDADVAIGSLTKVGAREDAIDFTGTWYKSQLKVAILHPSWTFEYPFSLVFPLHVTAWAALVALFVIISSMVFFLGYFSPYEYRRLAERGEATEEEAGTFSIGESIFYCLSTGFWQSFHRSPKSWSLRLLSMFWFWFCICTIFLYAWNVNSVFKFSKTAIKIKDVHDLLFNDIHEFGAVRNSPSYDFYRFNKGQYRMVFDRILNSDRNLLEDRIEEAIYRVRRQWDGRYAVLGEERILSYAADRKPCRLFISGKTLGKISFSFATPSGSPLRDQLSYALKVLKKRGNITRILDMKFSNSLKCARDTLWETETKKSFTVHDLQGMYYLMFCGMGGSVIVMILEWLLYVLAIDKGARPTFVGRRGDQGGHRAPPQNKMTTDFYGQDPKDAAPDKGATDWI